MAIAREVWLNIVENNLFTPSLDLIKQAIKDDSAFLYQGGGVSVVHIPNAGTAATVTKGNNTYPVDISSRTDSDNYYNLTNYEIGPIRVALKDGLMNSYEQAESILNDQVGGLGDRVAREILLGQYHYTSGLYVPTTGSSVTPHAPNGTGARKGLVGANVKAALGLMDKYSVKQGERYLIVDSIMAWQLLDDIGYTAYRDAVAGATFTSPYDMIPLWGGTKMIVLPQVLYAETGGTVRPIGHAGGTTDQGVALLVQKECTSMCMTDIIATTAVAAPGMFGDTYEASIVAGGKYRRTDKYGVVPIIQVAA